MKVAVRHINTVPGPNGTKYYYCRLTNTRLPSPADQTAFLAAVTAARAHLGENPTPASVRAAREKQAKAAEAATPADDRNLKRLIEIYRSTEDYRTLGEGTRKEYDRHIARLLDGLAGISVAAIEPSHVRDIMRKFTGTVGTAVKRMLSVLLTLAVDEGWIRSNPAFGLTKKKRKRRTKDENGDRIEGGQRPLEEAEIKKIREHNPRGTRRRALFEVLLGTGFRRGDSRRIPSDLSERTHLPLITNKTGQLVIAPVTDEARHAAKAWEQTRMETKCAPSDFLICGRRGRPLHERTVTAEVGALFDAAKLPSRGAHALRYTAAVRLLELGFAYEDIAEHLGHSTAKMARDYCRKRRHAELRRRAIDEVDAEGALAELPV